MLSQINTLCGGLVLICINNCLMYSHIGLYLCRYREIKYPENTENVVIHNNSDIQAEVQFSFKEDNHGTTFLLNPPTMILQPEQKQV